MSSGRLVDFFAGCVVGGALIATGLILGQKKGAGEELHVSMLKDDSGAMVWSVDPVTGKAKFVSFSLIPTDAAREMAREGGRRLGEMMASGGPQAMAADVFGAMAEGAARAKFANEALSKPAGR